MSTLVSTTCSEDGTITTFTLDGRGLTPVAASSVGRGVNCLAIDASGRHGYAGCKDPLGIAVLDLTDEGRWQVADRVATDASLTYLTISADGRFLLGVSYSGGFAMVWPLVDGVPTAPVARVEHRNLHCIIELDGFVYAVSLGEDLVACFRLGDDGSLTPLVLPTVAAPQGSGPRHLAVGQDGRNLYLVTEFSGEVLRLERNTTTGTLEVRESVSIVDPSAGLAHSRFGADPLPERLVWGADVHRAGNVLVASERSASTLVAVELDADGHLGRVGSFVATEAQPRGFWIHGDQVICPGEGSDQLSLFTLTGTELGRTQQVPNGKGANWVRVVSWG